MSNLGMLYCHSKPDSKISYVPLQFFQVDHINVGEWYYYNRYLVTDYWYIDLKESDDRFSRTILCFREVDMSRWFWDRVE